MSDSYSDQLVAALRLRDVPGHRIGQVVAEVEAYAADSGEDPVEAFGPADVYSATIAHQLRGEAPARRRTRELIGAYPPAVGSLLFIDGLWGTLNGQAAALTVGELIFAVVLPVAVLLLVAALRRARGWTPVAALIGAASMAVLWLGDEPVLLRYSAWVGLVAGAALLVGGIGIVSKVSRDPVIDPRDGRDRYPMTVRLALLACGPIAIMLILLILVALLTD